MISKHWQANRTKLTEEGYRQKREEIEALEKDKDVESGKVAPANAVVHPGAVVVVSVDAGVAEGAVAAPRSPYDLAVRTQATSLHRVEQLHEVHVFVLFECAWVT